MPKYRSLFFADNLFCLWVHEVMTIELLINAHTGRLLFFVVGIKSHLLRVAEMNHVRLIYLKIGQPSLQNYLA